MVRRQALPLPTFVDIEYLGLSITSAISQSIGLIFVSISMCTDLYLSHVLSESVSKIIVFRSCIRLFYFHHFVLLHDIYTIY